MSEGRNPRDAEEREPLLDIYGSKSKTDGQRTQGQCCGQRHVLAFMAFLGFFNVYCLRVNLSVALVDMVVNSNSSSASNNSDECPGSLNDNSTSSKSGEFSWDESTQGIILGAFFYGYIVTQIPGGWLAERFGGKKLFGFGVLVTAVLTLLTPVAARLSLGTLIAVRVLEGIGEGVTFPAMHAMWGKWAPLWERSKLTAFTYAGSQLGTVFAEPISGLLCNSEFLGGWPSVFYVFGVLGCLWFIAWYLLVHDTPADHPRISLEERAYIEESVGVKRKLHTPWKEILMTPAVWAINIAHFSNNWGFYTMLTCLPSYMKNVLKFNIQTNGLLSALPYFACWLAQNISGQTADFLRSRSLLKTVTVRKTLNTFGLVGTAVILFCLQFAGCDHVSLLVMLTMSLGVLGFTMGGFQVNHIDLSPNFAGVLMGMSNSMATIPGFVAPQIVGILTNHNQSRERWQLVFYIAAGINICGAIFYLIFGRGTEQPWNMPQEDDASNSHEKTEKVTNNKYINISELTN
ncbi:hypothetical protein ACJMK2_001971 [Sinanodonta woodiana]|uniref:Sialin n=1 Tax=Sinanodonta woodiana TaxID=1069815 RepID=A0ABD3XVN8_SINWO